MTTRKIGIRAESREFAIEQVDAFQGEGADRKQIDIGTVQIGGDEYTQYRFTVSSEYPVQRSDWMTGQPYLEVLSHEPGGPNLKRFKGGAAGRDTHFGPQIAVVDDAEVLPNRKLQIDTRFSKSQLGQEVERDVRGKIRKNVSIRYIPMGKPKISVDDKTQMEVRTFAHWDAIHYAFEPDPADPVVGPGRAEEPEQRYEVEVEVESPQETPREEERSTMTEDERRAQEAAAQQAARTATAEAVAARNTQVVEIRKLARDHGVPDDKLDDMIGRGIEVRDAAAEILALRKLTPNKPPPSDPVAVMSAHEQADLQNRYSVRRAIEQASVLKGGGRPSGLEYEHHQRMARESGPSFEPGSFLIPLRLYKEEERQEKLAERARIIGSRSMGSAIAGAGADLVHTMAPIDLLDAFMEGLVLEALGANFIYGLKGELPMPRFTNGATFYCGDENPTAATTTSDAGTAANMLRPKTIKAKMAPPMQLLQLSQFDVEGRLIRMMGQGAARKVNKLALHGTGTAHQPLGLWDTPLVTAVTVNATNKTLAYGDVIDLQSALTAEDADGPSKGYITTTGIAGYCRKNLEFSAAGSTKMWSGPDIVGRLGGFPAAASNVCRADLGTGTNEHALFFGAWGALNVAQFGDGMAISVDPYSLSDYQQIAIRLFMMIDAGTAVPEAFAKLTGLLVKAAG